MIEVCVLLISCWLVYEKGIQTNLVFGKAIGQRHIFQQCALAKYDHANGLKSDGEKNRR